MLKKSWWNFLLLQLRARKQLTDGSGDCTGHGSAIDLSLTIHEFFCLLLSSRRANLDLTDVVEDVVDLIVSQRNLRRTRWGFDFNWVGLSLDAFSLYFGLVTSVFRGTRCLIGRFFRGELRLIVSVLCLCWRLNWLTSFSWLQFWIDLFLLAGRRRRWDWSQVQESKERSGNVGSEIQRAFDRWLIKAWQWASFCAEMSESRCVLRSQWVLQFCGVWTKIWIPGLLLTPQKYLICFKWKFLYWIKSQQG